jgi:type IV fimbrial biogenesis protein FimT
MSLVELMIGLAVLALLMMAGLPSYSVWMQNTRIRAAAESMVNGLQLARSEAVRRNVNVEFVLGPGSSWTVRVPMPLETIQSRSSDQGSANVAVEVTPGAAGTITFNSLGRVAPNADASPSIAQLDLDVPTSVMPAELSRELRVTVNAGGQIRMCDPTVAAPTDPRFC